jgi:hypothetical protein
VHEYEYEQKSFQHVNLLRGREEVLELAEQTADAGRWASLKGGSQDQKQARQLEHRVEVRSWMRENEVERDQLDQVDQEPQVQFVADNDRQVVDDFAVAVERGKEPDDQVEGEVEVREDGEVQEDVRRLVDFEGDV